MDPHARAFAFLGRTTISDDLVVPDSEPESSSRNTVTKTMGSTSQLQPRGRHTDRFSATGSVIETSNTSYRQLPRPDIIELTDSESGEEIQIIEKNHVLPTARPVIRPQPPPLTTATISSRFTFEAPISHKGDSGSETLSIDLRQFAYSVQPSKQKSRAASESSVRSIHSVHSTRSTLPAKPSNARTMHSATDFLTDREIGLLSRCVACDIAWTTKKTVPKKRHHLRICQKKNALTDETIHLRIERELAKEAEETTQKKGKGKAKENSVSPKKHATLMNAVVTDAQPKKRTKRKEKTPTIVGIQHQHDSVHEHAKRLLSLDSDGEDRSTPGLSATTSTTVPLTQEFPVSKIGTHKGFEVDMAISLPSPVASDASEERPISISSDSETRVSEQYLPLSSLGKGRHRDLQSALRQSLTLQNGEDEWMQDLQREIDNRESMAQWEDAGMMDAWHPEWHPTDLVGGLMEGDIMNIDLPPTGKKRGWKSKGPTAKNTTIPDTPVKLRTVIRVLPSTTSSPVKRKAGANPDGRTSSSKTQSSDAFDSLDQDHFNHVMQTAIMSDKALWERVLRYEPVNFTEFLGIALAAGEPGKKLIDKLRVFLVSKAIQVFTPKERKRR